MGTRTIDRQQLKLLLEHQQDELDTCRAYGYLADVSDGEEAATFRELASDEERHARVFQDITGEKLQAREGKQRRVALYRKVLGRNRFLKRLANIEQVSALRYEKLLEDFPELEDVKRDELRHFDALVGMMS